MAKSIVCCRYNNHPPCLQKALLQNEREAIPDNMAQITLAREKEIALPGILPKHLTYILRLYLTGVLCFTLFRLVLFAQEFHQLHFLPTGMGVVLVLKAFLMGLRFDTVVSGYILTFPFLLLCADAFMGWNSKALYRTVFWLINGGYFFSFFVSAADLPYFHHFYTRLNMAVMISADTAQNSNLWSGMVFKEWRYYWAFGPMLLISIFFFNRNRRLLRNVLFPKRSFTFFTALWSFSLFSLLLLLGIWGRFSFQSHIDAGTAYFSDYGLTNQLGLSPVYTFGLSYVKSLDPKNQEVHFMGDGEAVRNVQGYLGVPAAQEFDSPIARQVVFADSALRPNIVLVIMESMSANKMTRYGNPNNLTPFMDSLATQGFAFDSIFTSGIHTFAGIYSTLYGQPVIKRQHSLTNITPMSGFANTLKTKGYSTIYFTTHDQEFDNVGAFLSANGFDRIVCKTDYPTEKILSAFGVPDDYLYEHALGNLDELHEKGNGDKPFFATIMTGSDHGPYIIPKYFKPKNKDVTLGIVEYVDWSVRNFLEDAAKKPWFDNTLFIFVADHGGAYDKHYDLPLSFVHSPLIFYAPKLLGAPKEFHQLGSQLDIFPTVMGMLKMPYVNNTFGIDLFHQKRAFACAFSDDKFGVFNSEYMFVARENGVSSLYHYRTTDLKDYSKELPELAQRMKVYGESVFQAGQWLRKNGKTGMQAVLETQEEGGD